jgi:hypothetical protein
MCFQWRASWGTLSRLGAAVARSTTALCLGLVAPVGTASAQSIPLVEPTVIISGAKEDLSGIAFVAVCGPAGMISVGLSQEGTVRRFSSSGRSLGSFGRRGSGPGEIVQLGPFAFCRGDTLGFNDHALARATLVSPDLKLAGSFPLPRVQLPSGPSGPAQPIMVVSHGVSAEGVLYFGFNTRNPRNVTGHVLLVDTAGAVRRRVVEYPADPMGCTVAGPSSRTFLTPFCSLSWVANDPTLRFVALVSTTADQQGRGAYQLRVVGMGGRVILDREIAPRIDVIESGAFEAEITRRGYSAEAAAAVRNGPRIRRYPTTPPVLVAPDGSVWVLHRSATTQHWTVTNLEGRIVKEFRMRSGVLLYAATTDGAYGVTTDADGFENVVKVPIAR